MGGDGSSRRMEDALLSCFEGRDESGGGSHSEQDLLRDWHSYFCIFGYIFDGQERIIEFLGWGREIEG